MRGLAVAVLLLATGCAAHREYLAGYRQREAQQAQRAAYCADPAHYVDCERLRIEEERLAIEREEADRAHRAAVAQRLFSPPSRPPEPQRVIVEQRPTSTSCQTRNGRTDCYSY